MADPTVLLPRHGGFGTWTSVVQLSVSEVTIKRMPLLEQSIPGFTAAMFVWLMDATYQPDDD